jgi:hypothetical protein
MMNMARYKKYIFIDLVRPESLKNLDLIYKTQEFRSTDVNRK